MAHAGAEKLTREQLGVILPPEPTDTFKPIGHADLVRQVIEGLSFRHINVVRDEYAVSEDGMKLFGVMDLEAGMDGARYSLGIRNANDKSMRLGLTVGYRVSYATTWRSTATSRPCSPSIRSISFLRTRSTSVSAGCSATSTPCGRRSRLGCHKDGPRTPPSYWARTVCRHLLGADSWACPRIVTDNRYQ